MNQKIDKLTFSTRRDDLVKKAGFVSTTKVSSIKGKIKVGSGTISAKKLMKK